MRTAMLRSRRVVETFQFANPGRILTDLALSTSPWRNEELTFKTKDGLTMAAPNFPGARVPLYEIFVEDAYRMPWITRGLRPDATVLDIGGHIGCFTVAMAAAMPGATIHTYEASPVTHSWLARNVAANHLDGRVHPHHSAVSDHIGELTFADNSRGSGLNGLTAPASASMVTVPTVTFDEAVRRAGGAVDAVKMDTEGAEYDIILPSSPESWASVQRVAMEFHPVAGHSVDELLAFFAAVGLVERDRVSDQTPEGEIGMLWLERAQ